MPDPRVVDDLFRMQSDRIASLTHRVDDLARGEGSISGSGSGVAGRVALWTSTTGLGSDAALTFDSATALLTVAGSLLSMSYLRSDQDHNANAMGWYWNAKWNRDTPATYNRIAAGAWGGKAGRFYSTGGGSFVWETGSAADPIVWSSLMTLTNAGRLTMVGGFQSSADSNLEDDTAGAYTGLHIKNLSNTASAAALLEIIGGGAGGGSNADGPHIVFTITSIGSWRMGYDISLPGFVISPAFPAGTPARLWINNAGTMGINSNLVIGDIAATAGNSMAIRFRDTGTNNSPLLLTLEHRTSNTTPVASFGSVLRFNADSDDAGSNTVRAQAEIQALWQTAADATRKARLVLYAVDTASREGLRIEASGTAPMIGFLGAAAVIRQTVAAAAAAGGTGATAGAYDTAAHRDGLITLVNNIRTAGINLGLWA